MILISGCLAGINCRYDGDSKSNKKIIELIKSGKAIPVCPEQLGGLTTPRNRARIVGGDGKDVLAGKARVITDKEEDVTEQYVKGAKEALEVAKRFGIKRAVLKANSPSCGCGKIYSEDFTKIISGDGVATALFKKNKILVKTEEEF